jgi:hypothetical protein
MEIIDYSKTLKQLYTATTEIQEVNVETGIFLAVEGQGEPGGEVFQNRIQCLYATAYTLKFTLKYDGVLDFKMGKLECLYLSEPAKTPMKEWRWRFLLRVPEGLTPQHLAQAKKSLKERKGLDAAVVKRIRWKEGRALQVLHVGPFDQVAATYARLVAYAQQHGLQTQCAGHEIYLSDPRRVAAEKLKTIVRLPVVNA